MTSSRVLFCADPRTAPEMSACLLPAALCRRSHPSTALGFAAWLVPRHVPLLVPFVTARSMRVVPTGPSHMPCVIVSKGCCQQLLQGQRTAAGQLCVTWGGMRALLPAGTNLALFGGMHRAPVAVAHKHTHTLGHIRLHTVCRRVINPPRQQRTAQQHGKWAAFGRQCNTHTTTLQQTTVCRADWLQQTSSFTAGNHLAARQPSRVWQE